MKLSRQIALAIVMGTAMLGGVDASGQVRHNAIALAPSMQAANAGVLTPKSPTALGVDVLSDTRGADFGPYLTTLLRKIQVTWLPLIPEDGRPPKDVSAETQISFLILPDGRIGAMRLESNDHKDDFNRAAWGAIAGIAQFPPLPEGFTGPDLRLRVHFLVNKADKKNSAIPPASATTTPPSQ